MQTDRQQQNDSTIVLTWASEQLEVIDTCILNDSSREMIKSSHSQVLSVGGQLTEQT